MSRKPYRAVAAIIFSALALTACAPYQYRGGVTGGALGGLAGAILDHRNPWRGGVVGATLGAVAGATIAEISVQGARQAAIDDRPVAYQTDDGRGYYYAEPVGPGPRPGCRRIRERMYEDGRLVRERVVVIDAEPRYVRHYRDYEEDD